MWRTLGSSGNQQLGETAGSFFRTELTGDVAFRTQEPHYEKQRWLDLRYAGFDS
jgi:hypothetical protein